jgi:hypothetical protein
MIFFVAAESTRIYSATRTMQIGRVVGIEVSAQAVALAVSIPTAIATGHVIAFVVGAAASGLVKLVLSHLVLPGSRVRIVWDVTATSEILSFGKWIFLSTLCAYVAVRWDIFALGRLEGMALLGVYGLANQITSVPHQMAMHATGNVLTPVLADAFRSSNDRFRERLAMARRAYIPVALLLFAMMAVNYGLASASFRLLARNSYVGVACTDALIALLGFYAIQEVAHTRSWLACLGYVSGGVVGSMIGSGIFIVSSDMVRQVGSAGWLIAIWVLTALLTIVAAVSYGELSAMFPKAGGQYVDLKEAYGKLIGFLYGWSFFAVIQTGTIAAVGVAFSKFAAYLYPPLSENNVIFEVGNFQLHAAQTFDQRVFFQTKNHSPQPRHQRLYRYSVCNFL